MTMDVSTLTSFRGAREFCVKMFDVCSPEVAFHVVAVSDFYTPHKTMVELTIRSGAMYSNMVIMPDIARELAAALLESAAEAERIAAEVAQ